MTTSHHRSLGLAGMLGALALLGGCVATGPVGYDDYSAYPSYGYGAPPAQVDIDVYSQPGYRTYPGTYPGYPYYGQRRGYDPRWDGGYRRPPPPRQVIPVPVPVPYPVPSGHGARPPGGWQQPGARPPYARPPQAQPGQPGQPRVIRGQRIPGLPSGSVIESAPVPLGDRP